MFTRQNITLLLLIFCLAFSYSNLNAEIIFFDNFESFETNQYPTGDWWRTLYNGVSARISNDYAFDLGTKSFRLEGYSNWSRIDGININYENQITYQVCVYILDTQKGAIVGFFESQGNMAPSYNAVFFRNDGKICIHDAGEADIELQSYNSGQWYVVTVSIDFTNNSMDVYIDGDKIFSGQPRSTKDHCQTFALATNNFSTTGTAVCYFDNVAILNNFIQTSDVVSTMGGIWAFAYDWWWSKQRNRDGRYAETKLIVPTSISHQDRISLSLWNWYSQASGSAHCKVYLSTQQQVTPTNNNHNLFTWWVGNQANLGTLVGEYDAVNTATEKHIDITDFITANNSEEYYVAIENQGHADVAAGGIYICGKYSPLIAENYVISVHSAWDNDPNTNYAYPWNNIEYIIGPPDGNYAYTNHPSGGNGQPTAILDFGATKSASGLKIWLDDPYGNQTNLHVFVSSSPSGPWDYLGAPQGSGEKILSFSQQDVRYVKLSHGQTTPVQEDGIDAIKILTDIGASNCLYVVQTPDPNIIDILNELKFNVTTSNRIPSDLSSYNLVICREYSACTPTTAAYVGNFVKSGGGAILMGGTPSSFGGGGYSCTNIADWFGTGQYSNVGVSDARVAIDYPLGTSLVSNDVIEHCGGWGGAAVENVAADVTVMAMWDYCSGNIHSFIRSHQNGRVAFWAGNASYNSKNQELFEAVCSWVSNVNTSIHENNQGEVIKGYHLFQNYPNPFNPVTKIGYQIAESNYINLTIYNIRGERIKQLVNQYQSPGEYSVVWDGIDNKGCQVSSGIYIYRLETGWQSEFKRMLLIR